MSVVAVGLGVCMWRTIYLVPCRAPLVCELFGVAGYNFRSVLTGSGAFERAESVYVLYC
jgi:hypothetical protein